jgi:fructosamine-3-kinase
MLPEPLRTAVIDALLAAGDASPLCGAEPVTGGYASSAARLTTGRRTYFLKWEGRPRPGAFPAEASGLSLLARVGSARVPAVLAAVDAEGERPGFLLQEWIDAQPAAAYWQLGARYGERIARLHWSSASVAVPGYGLDHDNYVGKTPQVNRWQSDWVCFFREQRLAPQLKLAAQQSLLPVECLRRLERLLERLPEWLGAAERQPVLLHGDLWSGNVLIAPEGEPVLIDPAVCWGDREFDLATVQIYQEAPPGFYDGYRSVWPFSSGFAERSPLHNLYLNLCCLTEDQDFGFVPRIESVLRRYLG